MFISSCNNSDNKLMTTQSLTNNETKPGSSGYAKVIGLKMYLFPVGVPGLDNPCWFFSPTR